MPAAERDALSGIDLSHPPRRDRGPGRPSGGGKTSLVNLVPRFYHASQGRIRIDGEDIESLTLHSLRASIAHVGQDVFLFDDTVAANIAYGGKRGASREEIAAAASAAHALDFIQALPQGFDTMIGENGSRLSGGQRQRIAIARAILKDAPILILDEATSALDSESERAVQEALEALMRGAHHAGHRAPPVHRRACRPHRGAGAGAHCRDRQPCRVAGSRRRLCLRRQFAEAV
jgi:subfamily B ATP-binding cassette protein MsbA